MEISLRLEKVEERRIFLKDKKGRLIVWPRDFLPAGHSIGDDLRVFIGKSGNQEALAKDILNEILNLKS